MTLFYFSPAACRAHDPNPGHPEAPERLVAIDTMVRNAALGFLQERPLPAAQKTDLLLAHSQAHIDHVFDHLPPPRSLNFLDPDTALSPGSGDAALHAVGAVLESVKTVLATPNSTAFCAIRPPGHHAHKNHAAGFCLFNNVAIGAMAALQNHGLRRVAILDFDVHHGDGTNDIMRNNPAIFFASTYQYPLYASDQLTRLDTGIQDNVLNIAFPPGTNGKDIVAVWSSVILPKLAAFQPEMIFVSAGFDGHCNDPLAQLCFTTQDYADLMRVIVAFARKNCAGKLVAVLEGGYNLEALAESVLACLHVMGEENGTNR